jgi:hypothetical protein
VLYFNQYTSVMVGLAVTVQTSWTEDPVVTVYVGCETDTTGTARLKGYRQGCKTDTTGTARLKGYRQGWQECDDICNKTDLLEDLLFT